MLGGLLFFRGFGVGFEFFLVIKEVGFGLFFFWRYFLVTQLGSLLLFRVIDGGLELVDLIFKLLADLLLRLLLLDQYICVLLRLIGRFLPERLNFCFFIVFELCDLFFVLFFKGVEGLFVVFLGLGQFFLNLFH